MKHITQTDLNGIPVVAAQTTGQALQWNGTNWISFTVISNVLTGYTSGAGTVAATDTILQAIQKLNGNTALCWKLDGNTVGSEKWIGTIDNYALPFRTNNTEVARFTATGNFGINNTSPDTKLDVSETNNTTANSGVLKLRNTGSGVNYTETAILFNTGLNSNADFLAGRIYAKYDSASASDCRITLQSLDNTNTPTDTLSVKNKNVGIGINTPVTKLDVVDNNNTAAYASVLKLRNIGDGSNFTETGILFHSSTNLFTADFVAGRIYTKYNTSLSGDVRMTFQSVNASDVLIDTMSLYNGRVGVGITDPLTAAFQIVSTTEQLRVGYDASNYYSTTVSSAGAVTFNAVGASAEFIYSDPVRINSAASSVLTSGFTISKANTPLAQLTYVDGFGAYQRMYRDGGATIAFEFVGSGSVSYINTGQNFGIGIAAPLDQLNIDGGTGKGLLISSGTSERAWLRYYNTFGGYMRLIRDDGSTIGFELASQGTRGYINTGQNFAIGTNADMGAALGVTGYQRNIGNLQVEEGTIKVGATAYAKGALNKVLYRKTSDAATTTELTTDGAAPSGATNRVSVPTDTALSVVANISVKQQSSGNSWQMIRQFIIVNNGGTTSLEGSVITIGTDNGSAALNTVTCTITANDTNDCIKIEVNGVAATNLEFCAFLTSSEVAYQP